MPFMIDMIEFQGPISEMRQLEGRPGVFVLLETANDETQVIDFGFANDLQHELSNTVRDTSLWNGALAAGYKYVDSADEAEPLVQKLEFWFDNSETSFVSIANQSVNV